MSIAQHHNEWLSLVPNSGPFLSLPVLMRVFPQGLPTTDPELRKETRLMFEGWEDARQDRAIRSAWFNFVLRSVLQFPAEVVAEGQGIPPGIEARMPEFGEVLRPDVAIIPPKGSNTIKPRLLIQFLDADQDLEKPLRDRHWKASPATRMTELLHAADVPLGLITNGEHWMLVHAPRGETSGFASWYASLWVEEPLTFQAFTALLSAQRFFGVAEKDTIEALLAQSAQDQQEVTEQLGWQVRKAVEVLIQSFDKIDQDYGRTLLEGVEEKQMYEAALTVMMRLVFLFSAEERDLLLLGDPLYDQNYAVSTLREQLQEIADQNVEEILDARFDAWSRLLATFRAVYGGVKHEAMRLPPYGGTLFDPDRHPFLEGRKPGTSWRNTPAEPIKVNNRTVLHLLNALQVLQAKVPGSNAVEARRLSFRSLDIEQIGHVYEGLLDHTAKRASEPVLGLKGSKDKEPEIPLSKLEELAGGKVAGRVPAPEEAAEPFLLAAETPGNIISLPKGKGSGSYAPPEKLVEFIKEETGRSVGAIKRELTDQSAVDEGRLLLACGHDRELLDRVWPFAALLRDDTFGFPVVIPTGSVYVTQGSDRRSTGTHYTPRSLTEPIVQHTLEPLVYIGPAEGTPREQWKLKTAREILELKVCDMAMGSGAFLVQTCRYMSERLVEAWENVEKDHPGCFVITPEGELSTGSPGERLLPKDSDERLTIARRFVADRCLYGVDINPMAVEMAKLSLWLITLQRDRPFTFLDHALRCGDSLLGVSSVKQIENFSLREGERQVTFATANLFRYVDEATEKRRALENLPSNDHTQIEAKRHLYIEAEAATAKVKALADCLIAFELQGLDGEKYEEQRTAESEKVQLLMKRDADESVVERGARTGIRENPLPASRHSHLASHAREQLGERRPFHWPVEFPEVFQARESGFDAAVGNPPWGAVLSPRLKRLLDQQYSWVGDYETAHAFIERFHVLCKPMGHLSAVLPNTFLLNDSAQKARSALLSICRLTMIANLTESTIFSGAMVRSCVVAAQNSASHNAGDDESFVYTTGSSVSGTKRVALSALASKRHWLAHKFTEPDAVILETVLGDYFEVKQGYIPYRKSTLIQRLGEEEATRILNTRAWHAEDRIDETYVRELKGKDVQRWKIDWSGLWVKYGRWVATYLSPEWFTGERVLVREIVEKPPRLLIAASCEDFFVHNPSIIVCKPKKELAGLCAVLEIFLNSNLASVQISQISAKAEKGLFPKVLVKDLRALPFPDPAIFTGELLEEAQSLRRTLKENDSNWPQGDAFVTKLFGIAAENAATANKVTSGQLASIPPKTDKTTEVSARTVETRLASSIQPDLFG